MKKFISLFAGALLLSNAAFADVEKYQIDIKGMHAFIEFKIKHLGYSWLTGRFNDFDGQFSYDTKNPENSSVNVMIKTKSIDSNHAERDKHLRGKDFLEVSKYPAATFKSTKVVSKGKGKADIHGVLSLHGVKKDVVLDAVEIGTGNDPWGGYRRGFTGTTTLALKDYGIDFNLGPASQNVEMTLHIEGVRQ
jgi:polyisoprenoid-binding protein YceI